MLHLGGLQDESGIQAVSGIQIQPTFNLLLGGVLSPRNNNNDLSIYYHIILGYIPKWKSMNISSNMIQIGIHRYRFGQQHAAPWPADQFPERTAAIDADDPEVYPQGLLPLPVQTGFHARPGDRENRSSDALDRRGSCQKPVSEAKDLSPQQNDKNRIMRSGASSQMD